MFKNKKVLVTGGAGFIGNHLVEHLVSSGAQVVVVDTSRFFEQAISHQPITVFGSGKQTRDFTWVKDAVKATLSIAEKISGFEIFNVSNEGEHDIASVTSKIKSISNSSSEVLFVNAPAKRYDYEVGRRFGSSEKLFKHTGYKPNTLLDDGLRAIYAHLTDK